MTKAAETFSDEQWTFLAVLHVFGGPVPIKVAGTLVPLLPGPLFDLLNRAQALGWIEQDAPDRFTFKADRPNAVREELRQRCTPTWLRQVTDRVLLEGLDKDVEPLLMLDLLDRAGRIREASRYEIELAQEEAGQNHREAASRHLKSAVNRLFHSGVDANTADLYLSAVLALSNLCFVLGHSFQETEKHLEKSHELTDRIGDRRSHALINLHLGRLYYFADRRDEALVALSVGLEEIQELGDDDILAKSAVFIGMFYFIKGYFKEAIAYFDKAERGFSSERFGLLNNPTAPLFSGYCAAYLGLFHRAIGSLDFNWRLARKCHDPALSSTVRAVLGTVLGLLQKRRKADFHLKHAQEEAARSGNTLGQYFAGGGIAMCHFMEGRIEEAHRVLRHTFQEGARGGLIRQYASPWVLEMVCAFHRKGLAPIPGFEYEKVLERVWNGVNIHLQGVALRLEALEKMASGKRDVSIRSDLAESEKLLGQSGDPVQLSKTLLVAARLELLDGEETVARHIALRAWRVLGGYAEDFFPDDCKYLIDEPVAATESQTRHKDLFAQYLDLIESLYPSENQNEMLTKILIATARMFGAERSGLFQIASEREGAPELLIGANLSRQEVASDWFRPSMDIIRQTCTAGEVVSRTVQVHETALRKKYWRSTLCIPVDTRGKMQRILYYDNSYLNASFESLDAPMLKRIIQHLGVIVERWMAFFKIRDERNLLSSEKRTRIESQRHTIIAHAPVMVKLLEQADRVAATESTILITGETGTGKELLANRIHRMSLRADAPFIVVDATTIPPSLLESELFGHERGAFTGADQRKIGRIELAHEGTLFLDEIGELDMTSQTKLLRALQEKSFHRIGATRTRKSDFRLVAATNRSLSAEVEAGNFRRDLYFRLNVIPLHLPPLRDRRQDIIHLVKVFLNQYATRYKKTVPELEPLQKKAMHHYRWPGNVRELKNIVERAVILSEDGRIHFDLPSPLTPQASSPFEDRPDLNEIQRRYIHFILECTSGKISGAGGACEILGMKRTSLYSRMKALGINRPRSLKTVS